MEFTLLQASINLKSFNGQTQYQSGVEPTIYNEFEAAAFRYGHSMIPGKLYEIRNYNKSY
jgi:hypothetical protein